MFCTKGGSESLEMTFIAYVVVESTKLPKRSSRAPYRCDVFSMSELAARLCLVYLKIALESVSI